MNEEMMTLFSGSRIKQIVKAARDTNTGIPYLAFSWGIKQANVSFEEGLEALNSILAPHHSKAKAIEEEKAKAQ